MDLLESEGAEAVVPDLTDFLLYCCYNQNFKADYLGATAKSKRINNMLIRFFEWLRKDARDELAKSKHFEPTAYIQDLAKQAEHIVSCGNQTGEGWFLTGEMLELIAQGATNIVCAQPFACLPNHIVGKGVIKEIRHEYPGANIVAIDYDPGASEVNQLNRIKLMLSTAQKNLKKTKFIILRCFIISRQKLPRQSEIPFAGYSFFIFPVSLTLFPVQQSRSLML